MTKRISKFARSAGLLVAAAVLAPLVTPPARAQSLPEATLALYPPEAGELAYADLHTLRQSPHYRIIHDAYFPPRLRQLESQALSLGIDFEAQAQQLSWAYLVSPSGGIELISIAEGSFAPSTVVDRARALRLPVTEITGKPVISMGQNEAGQAFALAFPDSSKLVFGTRDQVEAMLNRASTGSPGFLQNQTLAPLLTEANGRSSIWSVMDQRFAALEIRNIAPDAANRPEAQTLLNNLHAAVARATLGNDLTSAASFLCNDASQAALLAAVAQAGFALYSTAEASQNPDMAAALHAAVVQQSGDRVELTLSLTQSQISTLLARSLPARR
ncbi:MAG TPA: hypothetical protein VLW54_07660 [Candidatus Acidoferrales bacterium]|nr:hypothetical protein [Candidatus Acidoferrales bacterium]